MAGQHRAPRAPLRLRLIERLRGWLNRVEARVDDAALPHGNQEVSP